MVATYAETKSIKECLMIQRRIVNDYLNDMAKYAISGDKIKARECFQSIPVQLAKENKKFQYSVVKKDTMPAITIQVYNGSRTAV